MERLAGLVCGLVGAVGTWELLDLVNIGFGSGALESFFVLVMFGVPGGATVGAVVSMNVARRRAALRAAAQGELPSSE